VTVTPVQANGGRARQSPRTAAMSSRKAVSSSRKS
jgi:hypothetical protein